MGGTRRDFGPRVWNKRDPNVPAGAVYVGRGQDSKWGNPYTHHERGTAAAFRVSTREEAIERYRWWITEGGGTWLLNHLRELKGRDLVCWCKPAACHGDVLLELANAADLGFCMTEARGDIWELTGDAIVITTNGAIKRNGECVMGRGVALQAKTRYPRLPLALGRKITRGGNHVYRFLSAEDGRIFYSFPVKHVWNQPADLDLIARSARELVERVREQRILVPRPGCGNGGRDWDEVRPVLEPVFDDRFVIVTF